MHWDLSPDRPIYLQLMEKIKIGIVSGVYPAGSQLPAVRSIAADAAVNPNTMQKALAELEREGLVYSRRTSGRFITEDENMIRHIKEELAQAHIHTFIDSMKKLGFSDEELIALLEKSIGEEK